MRIAALVIGILAGLSALTTATYGHAIFGMFSDNAKLLYLLPLATFVGAGLALNLPGVSAALLLGSAAIWFLIGANYGFGINIFTIGSALLSGVAGVLSAFAFSRENLETINVPNEVSVTVGVGATPSTVPSGPAPLSQPAMLKKLYDWTLSLTARKSAEWWLAFIAFLESSVFPVPAEVLFVPMGLARPDRVYRYALIVSMASVLGGIAGWLLGYYAYELIARPVLEFYGSLGKFELLRSSSSRDAILLMLITSGIAHLPPMKVVTILSGAAAIDFWLFVGSAILARGGKFFLIAWLLRRYGEPIRDFIEKRLGLIALGAAAALILLYVAFKVLFRSIV